MEPIERLKLLSDQMALEPAEESCLKARPRKAAISQSKDVFIHPAQMSGGKQILLLKTLLSSACERDCYYCPFRAGRDFRRATFQPDEFANLFYEISQAGMAQGIFLSSGLAGGGIRTQDKLIATAEILRQKFGFQGYIHLKVMPGAEKSQVERAMQLADRISINLEAPNTERLTRLAPHKIFFEELLQPLRWVDEIRKSTPPNKTWNGRWPSTVTQFVAGGSDESDLELLSTTAWLTKNAGLKRAYFSAFHPIPDTPMENKTGVDPVRENRLYQASFLLRDFGFELEELPLDNTGNLPLSVDPKLAWAKLNLSENPIEVNKASRSELLRIPGIGIKGAETIIFARRQAKLQDLSSLHKIGILANRAAPFILLNGKRTSYQITLF